jgi:hypothetical protein
MRTRSPPIHIDNCPGITYITAAMPPPLPNNMFADLRTGTFLAKHQVLEPLVQMREVGGVSADSYRG